jgi:DNA-binding CsgD family transcriptional regulator
MKADLIDRIYECSFVPELWPSVLDEVARLTDTSGGVLFAAHGKGLKWTASAAVSDIVRSYVDDGWFARCDRRVCMYSRVAPTFVRELDSWSQEELDANPIYRDFFRPRGLGWSAGTGLSVPTGDNLIFTMERPYGKGPIEADTVGTLNELRPHLARAALIAARLSLQNAKAASTALADLGLPALVLDESGVVLEANTLMNDLTEHLQWQAHNRLALNDGKANAMLMAALPALSQPADSPVNSFPLRDKDGRAAFVAHLVPIRRAAQDIFAHACALLIVTPVTSRRSPPVELLRSLFDLTPSEARVARGLAVGESLDDIAGSGGVSRNTVRSQLQQVLEKMGCSRQAEVTAMLSNVTLG